MSDRIPAYALYIDPPLGRVGLSETEARKTGRPLLVSKRPMTRVGRAIEKGETKGFMKVVADAQTKQILGAAILGVSWRRGDPRHSRHDECRSDLSGPAMGGADPPDRLGTDPDRSRRPEAGRTRP